MTCHRFPAALSGVLVTLVCVGWTAPADVLHAAPRALVGYRVKVDSPGLLANSAMQLCSPLVTRSGVMVLVGTHSGKLLAMGARSGRLYFERTFQGAVMSVVELDGQQALVGTENGTLYRIALADGSDIWPRPLRLEGALRVAPRVWRNRVAFVQDDRDVLSAVSLDQGTLLGEFDEQSYAKRGVTPVTAFGQSTPLVTDGFLVTGFETGVLVRFDLTPGSLDSFVPRYRASVCSDAAIQERVRVRSDAQVCTPRRMFRDVDSSPLLSEYGMLSGCHCRGLFLMDPATGAVLWDVPMPGPSTPVAHGDVVVVAAADGRVLAVEAASGAIRWETRLESAAKMSLTLVGTGPKAMVVVTTGKDVVVLDVTNGDVLLRIPTLLGVVAPPSVQGAMLHLLSNEGMLYQIDLFR